MVVRNILSVALLGVFGSSYAANLVVNGDFEATAPGSFTVAGQGLPGWTVLGSAGTDEAYVTPAGYLLPLTSQMLDISGYSDKSAQGVKQMLSTVPAQVYSLKFDYWTGGTGYTGPIDVFLDGAPVVLELTNNPGGLSTFSTSFVATGPTELKFLTGSKGWVNHIDNVEVEAVPEPASMAALGLGALAALRRRRGK